jgi:ABC-2 type transport system permease protein
MLHPVLTHESVRAEGAAQEARRPLGGVGSLLRGVAACTVKDIRSAMTERSTFWQTITLPINYCIMLILFVLSGSNAPTAVVMQDQGPYARAFYAAMGQSHSFSLRQLPAGEARAELQAGTLVAVVTIPADFDEAVSQRRAVRIPVQINNLNEDLTDDARRAMGLSITTFYAHAFPDLVGIVTRERDQYPTDTDYIPFLSLAIMVISLMVTGLLQAGMASAREWERGTIKELLLAPRTAWVVLLGKILAVFVIGLPSVAVVLAFVAVLVGDWPVNFPMVVGVSLLSLLVFVAAGVALGMALKDRATVTTLTRALAVPLFFLSGVFGPISYSTPAVQVLARAFPVHYAITLEQYAFKGFVTNTLPMGANALLLACYAAVFLALAVLAYRLSRVAH